MVDVLIPPLKLLLDIVQGQRIEKEKKYQEAVEAILKALTQTQIYLERGKNKERDRTKELELSELWEKAAITVTKIDPGLANELKYKGKYWLENMKLSKRQLYQSEISLIQVRQKYEKLYSELKKK